MRMERIPAELSFMEAEFAENIVNTRLGGFDWTSSSESSIIVAIYYPLGHFKYGTSPILIGNSL